MSPIRVLIADDEETMCESLASVIASDPDLEVVGTAADAQEAIDLATASRPDVALIDVRMPGGGPRAAREIALRCAPTRILALSAFEDRMTVMTMIRAGAQSYIGKGASNEQILRAIHGTAAGNTELSPSAMTEVFGSVAEVIAERPELVDEREPVRERIASLIARRAVDFAFQPVARLDTLGVVGIEAFARFRTLPRRPPQFWFDQAAGVGLMRELELTGVAVALEQVERVPAGCYLSLNVTHETAASSEFVDLVTASDPVRIVVELSEPGAAGEGEGLIESLAMLRARGARVAMDDAGAGFASLRRMVRVAPDLIKLDARITRDVAADPGLQALVSSVQSFAFDLGAAVIAKGVETARQLETLRALGIVQAQGYYLARPSRLPDAGKGWGRTTF